MHSSYMTWSTVFTCCYNTVGLSIPKYFRTLAMKKTDFMLIQASSHLVKVYTMRLVSFVPLGSKLPIKKK